MIPKIHKDFIENTIKVLQKDSRIAGLATGGSYITKEMDEYSDLDFVICVEDEFFHEVMNERIEIAEKLGMLLSGFTGEHVGEPRLLICLYGPELLHIDLKFICKSDAINRVEDPVILFEKDECLSKAKEIKEASFPIPPLQWMEDRFWVWIHYGATKIGRGEIFEAVDFIASVRQMVIGPLIHMKNGQLPKGVRKIETYAPDYVEKLKETIATYSKESCVNSLNTIIEMYLELREDFITEDFIKKEDARKYAIEYLNKIDYKIE